MKNLIAPLLLAAVTGVLVPSSSLAAAPAASFPELGHGTPCRASGPVVIAPGAAPLRPLRLDLAAVAGTRTR